MHNERWIVISPDECAALLHRAHLGRIAVVDRGLPLILPVNFLLDDADVVFRTNPGTKLDAALRHAAVAFEIDGTDEETRTGWSVLIRGHAHEVSDAAELARLEKLEITPWAPGTRQHYIRVTSLETTGRRITLAGPPANYLG